MTEWLHFHFSISCFGEGNGNLLQCSCLENPRDGGAWWAAVSGVSQSWTWLKQLSSSSSSNFFQVHSFAPSLLFQASLPASCVQSVVAFLSMVVFFSNISYYRAETMFSFTFLLFESVFWHGRSYTKAAHVLICLPPLDGVKIQLRKTGFPPWAPYRSAWWVVENRATSPPMRCQLGHSHCLSEFLIHGLAITLMM